MDPTESSSLNDQLEKSDTKIKIPKRKKSKKDKIVKSCSSNFDEYSSCTSIHGIQYLGANKKTPFERFWWLVMIVISITVCSIFIRKLWVKWVETPVIVTFAETATPIWQIPFPAVTICPKNRISQSKFNFTAKAIEFRQKNWTDFTKEEQLEYRAVGQVCKILKLQNDDFAEQEVFDKLESFAPDMSEDFDCSWKRNKTHCNKVMVPRTTDKGLCYTFNGLDSTEIFRENTYQYTEYEDNDRRFSEGWTLENGYPVDASPFKTYPRRIATPAVSAGFTVQIISSVSDHNIFCSGPDAGYRISLHSPTDYPRLVQEYFIAPFKQELMVSIKPSMISTSPALAEYEPVRRKCYMGDEKMLKYFKIYSLKNCEWECLTNYTMNVCGCVGYWMPRDKWMPLCSTGKIQCMKNARYELEELEMKYEYAKATGNKEELEKINVLKSSCDCMPSCTSLSYEAEVTQNNQNYSEIFKLMKLENADDITVTRLKFFFKESQIITSKRSELYGMSDFISNCGGILGLFMGFSLLSLVEIIYFMILRPICALREKKEQKEK